jgi:hypothetical protein
MFIRLATLRQANRLPRKGNKIKVGELPFDGCFHDVRVEGRSGEEISYHIMLLHEAGLIEAIDLGSNDGVSPPSPCRRHGSSSRSAARDRNGLRADCLGTLPA